MEYTGERFIPDSDGLEIEAEHVHRYKAILSYLKNMKVLDAGCGTGYGSLLLSQHAKHVTGIDISSETVEWCNERYNAQHNLKFVQASLEKLPFNDSVFDCIVTFEVIEHVDKRVQDAFLLEAKRVLKPDGILIISTPNKRVYTDKSGYHNPYHISEFYFDEFNAYLKKEFGNIKIYNQSLFTISSISDEKRNTRRVRVIENTHLDAEGKYMIALCSNEKGILSSFDVGSIYKYDSPLSTNMSSLYFSTNEGSFSEDKRINKVLTTEDNHSFSITFDVSQYHMVKQFRFDPIENFFCICNIENVITDGTFELATPLNALKFHQWGFLFMNIDPQFEIKGDFHNATYITINGRFKIMSQIEISEIFDQVYRKMIANTNNTTDTL